MKVCYISSDPEVDVLGHEGSSVHIRELIEALSEAGHEVVLITPAVGGCAGSTVDGRVYQLSRSGLDAMAARLLEEEELIRGNHLERDLASILFNCRLLAEGPSILAKERPDFIYERYALFGWGGVELARRYGVPLILEVNAPLCSQQAGYEKFTLPATAAALEPEIFRRADALIPLSSWLEEWIGSHGVARDKIFQIPDAVNDRLFGIDLSGNRVKSQYRIENNFVVGHVGSYQWFHDIRGLFEAFEHVYHQEPRARLLLVGDGPELDKLTTWADEFGMTDVIITTGAIAHECVPHYIAAMDVAVVPYQSVKDFFFSPLKLFECMAVGTPTVAANLGQISEIISDGRNGLLYPAGDARALAERVMTLIRAPEVAARLGAEGRKTVLDRYTWRSVAEQVVEIAQALIAGRESSR